MLYSIEEANRLIARGLWLHIAGDIGPLSRLDRGNWIGGSIPYFLTADGGRVSRDAVFVTELPPELQDVSVDFVAADQISEIPQRAPLHGFSLIVMPGGGEANRRYAEQAPDLPGLFDSPVIGWVAGVHLDVLGHARPRVIDGSRGESSEERIVVLRGTLPEAVQAEIGIINLFRQGNGDRIRFPQTGFVAQACWVNDQPACFFEYVKARGLDTRLPLVAERSGEMINVSFAVLDEASRSVQFYAPVQAGVAYRQASELPDYHAAFAQHVAARPIRPSFACNCVLNYLYGSLDGERALAITGPATFGEIGYVLLNQTMVYLELKR